MKRKHLDEKITLDEMKEIISKNRWELLDGYVRAVAFDSLLFNCYWFSPLKSNIKELNETHGTLAANLSFVFIEAQYDLRQKLLGDIESDKDTYVIDVSGEIHQILYNLRNNLINNGVLK